MPELKLPAAPENGVVILVSGGRQAGKTTLLDAVRTAAQEAGLSTGGFLSLARIVNGVKDGIDLMDAASGNVSALATYQDDLHGAGEIVGTGHYVFAPDALRTGLAFAEAGRSADVFFVDELGPLELERGQGWADVLPMVRARAFGVAFVVVRPELLATARDQLGLAPDTPVIDVAPGTRDDLTAQVVAWVQARAASA